jgi:hypothetical protein
VKVGGRGDWHCRDPCESVSIRVHPCESVVNFPVFIRAHLRPFALICVEIDKRQSPPLVQTATSRSGRTGGVRLRASAGGASSRLPAGFSRDVFHTKAWIEAEGLETRHAGKEDLARDAVPLQRFALASFMTFHLSRGHRPLLLRSSLPSLFSAKRRCDFNVHLQI